MERREVATAALAASCSNAAYANQAAARFALAKLVEKKPPLSGMSVYPCDVYVAWHLTSNQREKDSPLRHLRGQ